MDKLFRGTQVVYMPTHAKGNFDHPDVQWGFVTSGPTRGGAGYFCRFWLTKTSLVLKTPGNSQLVPVEKLWAVDSHTPEQVALALKQFC